MFDKSLSEYAKETMQREGVKVKTSHHVESLRWGHPGAEPPYLMDPKGCLTLKTQEEGDVGVGICVWVAGNMMNHFVDQSLGPVDGCPAKSITSDAVESVQRSDSWEVKKSPRGRALAVGERFRVQLQDDQGRTAVFDDVFAIGNNAVIEAGPLPATVQVAAQQAKWLAARLNKNDLKKSPPFSFQNMGMLAYIGDNNTLMQLRQRDRKLLPTNLTGKKAWLVWNAAYLTMTVSWRNRFRVAMRWMLNSWFGRDISRY